VAHELNQPLTAITTYARACERYLAMQEPDFDELREAVREINAEGLRAGRIIERLRTLVRNDEPAQLGPQDLNRVVTELHALLAADAREFGVRFDVDLAEPLPAVRADAAQIQQVILNLVRNAFEALSGEDADAGEVCLATSCTGTGEVELTIRDNGPGFSSDILARLFHPFATTKKAGTGLGLAMCRTIVQAHGGSIQVQAARPRGACVLVRLPASEGGAC